MGVISLDSLKASSVGDRIAFDKRGDLVDIEVPDTAGPATLIVREVTDALKGVEGAQVAGSVDRSKMWHVEAIVLDRTVVESLQGEMSVEALISAVSAAGHYWELSSTSAP